MAVKRNEAGKIVAKKFSLAQLEKARDANCGFCRACGKRHKMVEPDARNYTCYTCGNKQVFGAEELGMMQF